MYELKVTARFAAAHRLRNYRGNCEKLHGHNWRIDAAVRGEKLDELGMLIDFRDAKAALADIVGRLDHQYLNEVPPFDELNPTTENVARFIFEELAKALPEGVAPAGVTAWESEGCRVTYRA